MLQYFGIEDLVINVAAKHHDANRGQNEFSFSKNGFRMLNRRYFSVQCVQESEVLMLSWQDLEHMKRDFPFTSQKFFKTMT